MSRPGDDFDGTWLFAQECQFVAGADRASALPPIGLTEVAFAGRSNVGKSSLLNALTGRNHLARVSHTPGRTQQLNFFQLGQHLWLVDLPGHGYAEVSKAKKKQWGAVTETYIRTRPSLRRVMLLVDSRHGTKDSDEKLMDLMDEAALSYQVVMTKADKVKAPELEAMRAKLTAHLSKRRACHPEILVTSAHDGIGMTELRDNLALIAKGQA
ncbi:ribosome biogenesis GTP-binding protein YihA/YsxC [Dongia soli]|uniref:Probable GTP-binding protein EngB n=1 Tax=Dongia soli TaxID=600628 RepID=A0ABU5E5S4_9PROT|nr:ribosome biogenesis GTP-binding protein YihA/YsxC [Dongia soli]MDY0881657.1 ribosome biogenesis GTP-binding protein YihA/YsxC [Dongia soli]